MSAVTQSHSAELTSQEFELASLVGIAPVASEC